MLPVSPFSPCDASGISRYPHPEGEPCIYIYNDFFLGEQGFGQEILSFRPQYGTLETGNSRSNRFVRAPSTGGCSIAPRSALSVPHLDVNVDGG